MRILLVDDSQLFMNGLKNLLEASNHEVVGMAQNADEAIDLARRLDPEVVLMDVQMPGENGLEATLTIKTLYPKIEVVMMTVSMNDHHLFKAIAAGANGYLLKSMPPEEFIERLEGIGRGEPPLTPGMAGKILGEFARREQEIRRPIPQPERLPLTERQMQIVRMASNGRTYRQIATELNLSEATIKYHMGEIGHRLQLTNRAQIIDYATRHLFAHA